MNAVLWLSLALAAGRPAAFVPETTPVTVGLVFKNIEPKPAKPDPTLVKRMTHEQKNALSDAANEAPGPADELIERASQWLSSAGFQPLPVAPKGVIFAQGTAAMVAKRFGVRLKAVPGQPPTVHTPEGKPQLPEWLQKTIAFVSGLNTVTKVKAPPKSAAK